MSVLLEVLEELWSMFVGDRRLTALVLILVAVVAAAALWLPATRPAAGGVLLAGALAVLADSVVQAARKTRRS